LRGARGVQRVTIARETAGERAAEAVAAAAKARRDRMLFTRRAEPTEAVPRRVPSSGEAAQGTSVEPKR
jgi:hypothetical protein